MILMNSVMLMVEWNNLPPPDRASQERGQQLPAEY